jgi:hypothetical protein
MTNVILSEPPQSTVRETILGGERRTRVPEESDVILRKPPLSARP